MKEKRTRERRRFIITLCAALEIWNLLSSGSKRRKKEEERGRMPWNREMMTEVEETAAAARGN